MAVAEKAVAEKAQRSPKQDLPKASILGALYVLSSVFLIFTGLPLLWTEVLQVDAYLHNDFLSGALLLLVTAAVATGLVWLGHRLEGSPPPGFRAGVFVICAAVLVMFWIAVLANDWLATREIGRGAALGIAVVTAVLIGVVALRFLWRPSGLVDLEGQGWFTLKPYKGSQGLRVRRSTLVALLVIGFFGIVSLSSNGAFGSGRYGAGNLTVNRPFSGAVLGADVAEKDGKLTITSVAQNSPADLAGLRTGDVIAKVDGEQLAKGEEAKADFDGWLESKEPRQEATISVTRGQEGIKEVPVTLGAQSIPILFATNFTMPLILAALIGWMAWRVVHYPVFADFLIATEAEMNKVSWTTRKRLVQDTIVVLTTVVLLTVFLFVVDYLWAWLLSNDLIQVLQVNIRAEQIKQQQQAQW